MTHWICYECGARLSTPYNYPPAISYQNDSHFCNLQEDISGGAIAGLTNVALDISSTLNNMSSHIDSMKQNSAIHYQDQKAHSYTKEQEMIMQSAYFETRLKIVEEAIFLMRHKDHG